MGFHLLCLKQWERKGENGMERKDKQRYTDLTLKGISPQRKPIVELSRLHS